MTDLPSVYVIGSGPTGVSVAAALIKDGVQVCLIDADWERRQGSASERPSLSTLRTGFPQGADYLLGRDLSALRDMRDYSPKLRTAVNASFISEFEDHCLVKSDNFNLVGTLRQGGLSNIWGAGISLYDDKDFEGYPISYADMKASYRSVSEHIGISGSGDDDMSTFFGSGHGLQPPLALSPSTETLLGSYCRHRSSPAFLLGRSRNAVLSMDHNGRKACSLDMACMWGCHRGSVYNSADDIVALVKNPNITYQSGMLVTRLKRRDDGYEIHCSQNGNQQKIINAKTVVLAAGISTSTRLVLDLLQQYNSRVSILNTPAMAMAFWIPKMLGKPLSEKGFGMSQLSFRLGLEKVNSTYAMGLLYAGDAMAAPDLIAHSPFTKKGGINVLRPLLSGLVLGLVYLPSEFSDSHAHLIKRADGESELQISGGKSSSFNAACKFVGQQVSAHMRKIGAYTLPGSAKVYPPGAEVHYAGTLPMGESVSRECEVIGADGLYVVDGSVLNKLPAKFHTLTMMANADRVGHILAEKLKQ